jgi:ABC-2 family transporter protein
MSPSRVRALLGKDLRVLGRSRALLVALVLYPLLVALLVGLVARFAGDRPRVGFVDLDGIPAEVDVGGQRFDVNEVIDRVETEVDLVPMTEDEAGRGLQSGDIVAAIIVPEGFVSNLKSLVRQPELVLRTSRGGLAGRVERQTEALVYNLNRELQDAYIDANLDYVRVLQEGGTGDFLGNEFTIVGLAGAERLLAQLRARTADPASEKDIADLETFVAEAKLALDQTGLALRATANPITLKLDDEGRRTWLLSAQVQAYALALTMALLCIVVAAGAIASERDENVLARLVRGLVRLGELVVEKVALVVVVGVAVGTALTGVLVLVLALGGSTTFASWLRLPLLLVGLMLVAAAFGAFGVLLGVLARDTRTAALVALLVALPLVLLGILPEVSIGPAAWISAFFPFAHAVELFESTLYDADPWGTIAREIAWLAGLTLGFGALARLAMPRLLT